MRLLFLLLIMPLCAFADQKENLKDFDYGSDFVNMLISLVFVIGLIILTAFFLKKLMRSRMKHINQANSIRVLERRALNQKASLYLVDVLGKGIVIAESQHGIQLITEFSSDVNIQELMETQIKEEKPSAAFSEILQKIKKKIRVQA